jgi:hypothetical protein
MIIKIASTAILRGKTGLTYLPFNLATEASPFVDILLYVLWHQVYDFSIHKKDTNIMLTYKN